MEGRSSLWFGIRLFRPFYVQRPVCIAVIMAQHHRRVIVIVILFEPPLEIPDCGRTVFDHGLCRIRRAFRLYYQYYHIILILFNAKIGKFFIFFALCSRFLCPGGITVQYRLNSGKRLWKNFMKFYPVFYMSEYRLRRYGFARLADAA